MPRRTDDTYTHVLRLRCDWAVVFRADHGRFYVELVRGDPEKPRFILTSPVPIEAARTLAERLTEIVALIPSTRRSA